MSKVKLYDVPRNTRVRIEYDGGEPFEVTLDHIDGMYSFCKDDEGNVIHLAAWTEVEVVKGERE
jgi:hypothetical protein